MPCPRFSVWCFLGSLFAFGAPPLVYLATGPRAFRALNRARLMIKNGVGGSFFHLLLLFWGAVHFNLYIPHVRSEPDNANVANVSVGDRLQLSMLTHEPSEVVLAPLCS